VSLPLQSFVNIICTTCFNIQNLCLHIAYRVRYVFGMILRIGLTQLLYILNSINRLVFAIETQLVYCEVGTAFLNIIY
jgi:hypothetical protein